MALYRSFIIRISLKMQTRPISDFTSFQSALKQAKNVAVLTGAGVSAESGIPTFRGAGGFWRTYQAQDLATLDAFLKNPSLVWEFYHYRRELVLTKSPNAAHIALAQCEDRLAKEGKGFVIVTQNIDELHKKAGSKNVIELHGTLFKTQCLKCHDVAINMDSPICPALKDRGAPDADAKHVAIPQSKLPRCKVPSCQGLLRPHVVWFGEGLDSDVQEAAQNELAKCDLLLVVGTSAVVYPAALFAPQVAARGVPVAEFNVEPTPNTNKFGFYFEGPCGSTLPKALAT